MAVVADFDTSDVLYFQSTVAVSSESVDIDYYVYDDSAGTYTTVETQTITATGAVDGNYTVTMSVLGVPTLTLLSAGDAMITSLIENTVTDTVQDLVQ